MKTFFSILLLLLSSQLEARMYQWVDPATGHSQLSGKAPYWYRGEKSGPRVLVFEKNEIIDDTAVPVDEAQRVSLRSAAFKTKPAQATKVITTNQAVTNLEEQLQAIVESPEMEELLKTPTFKDVLEDNVDPTEKTIAKETSADESAESVVNNSDRVERLKALISAWDKKRTEEARTLVETEK